VVQGQRVKGQGHSVCNRQRRLTAKSVRICCLFNDEKGRGATWSAFMVARRNFPKRNIFEQEKTQKMLITSRQIDWREVGVAFELQCLCNCTLSSFFLPRTDIAARRFSGAPSKVYQRLGPRCRHKVRRKHFANRPPP